MKVIKTIEFSQKELETIINFNKFLDNIGSADDCELLSEIVCGDEYEIHIVRNFVSNLSNIAIDHAERLEP